VFTTSGDTFDERRFHGKRLLKAAALCQAEFERGI
jgi:hypothetical protein